jgi:hypothetical protein
MALFIAPVVVLGGMAGRRAAPMGEVGAVPLLPMLGAGLLVHLLPGTEHGEYVVLLWPLVALVGAGWLGVVSGWRQHGWWGVAGVHLLWGAQTLEIETSGPAPGEGCRVLGRELAQRLGPQEFLLGFEPLVAAEARRRVLPGLEMGAFSLARRKTPLRLTPDDVVKSSGEPSVGAVLLGERMFLHDGWNRGFSRETAAAWRGALSKSIEESFCAQIQGVGVGQFREEMTLHVRGECP